MVNGTPAKERKKPVRSPYLFPAYGLGLALEIAGRVESDGGGSLSEETLAIAMAASAKSSTFRLKTLTARQFGLLEKHGPNLSTTPLAKAIFKPTNDQEKANSLWRAFGTIPLFSAVAERYRGQPLPQGETLRNILEREFTLPHSRVVDAVRVLTDSAREAGALQSSGANVYLAPAAIAAAPAQPTHTPVAPVQEVAERVEGQPAEVAPGQAVLPSAAGQFAVTEQDLALLEDDEFKSFWEGLGKIARRRGRRQMAAADAGGEPQEEQVEE